MLDDFFYWLYFLNVYRAAFPVKEVAEEEWFRFVVNKILKLFECFVVAGTSGQL